MNFGRFAEPDNSCRHKGNGSQRFKHTSSDFYRKYQSPVLPITAICVVCSHPRMLNESLAKHNHDAKQGQRLCKQETDTNAISGGGTITQGGGHVCQTLLQEPSRANLTYPSPLRRRTSTAHDYVHIETLQATRWRSTSFSIKAKLATLWRHRSGQPLPIHRKQLARIYKHNLIGFRLEYRSRVLCIAVRCSLLAPYFAH